METIHAEIERGSLEKVVLARRVEVALGTEPDPADVLYRLRRQAPECTRFLIRKGGVTFLGATPEWLARKHRGELETEAVAGSIGALEPRAAQQLTHLLRAVDRGASVLVLEPISRRAVPWWPEWSRAVVATGGRADEWHLPNTLPASWRQLDRDAGFVREELGVRSLFAG